MKTKIGFGAILSVLSITGCAQIGSCSPPRAEEDRLSAPSVESDAVRQLESTTIGAVTALAQTCRRVSGPPQQPAGLGVCQRHHVPRSNDRFAAGWFQVVADTPGSTVEITSSTLYGVRSDDGSLDPIAGTETGRQGVLTWAGAYLRTPWFGNDEEGHDVFTSLPVDQGSATYTASIPTGRTLLHGGPAHANIDGYSDTVYVVHARTTGDAKIQIGVDYRVLDSDLEVNEIGMSDWYTGDCIIATARLTAPNDCNPPR